MPAPFLSGTLAPENSMFSTVVSRPLITQIAFPPELLPRASILARPPTPRRVRPFLSIEQTSPAYSPAASISITSASCAAAAAAHGVLNALPGPTLSVAAVAGAANALAASTAAVRRIVLACSRRMLLQSHRQVCLPSGLHGRRPVPVYSPPAGGVGSCSRCEWRTRAAFSLLDYEQARPELTLSVSNCRIEQLVCARSVFDAAHVIVDEVLHRAGEIDRSAGRRFAQAFGFLPDLVFQGQNFRLEFGPLLAGVEVQEMKAQADLLACRGEGFDRVREVKGGCLHAPAFCTNQAKHQQGQTSPNLTAVGRRQGAFRGASEGLGEFRQVAQAAIDAKSTRRVRISGDLPQRDGVTRGFAPRLGVGDEKLLLGAESTAGRATLFLRLKGRERHDDTAQIGDVFVERGFAIDVHARQRFVAVELIDQTL